jgi:photosystem II stability/assembly factor-like uncharacterized protein
MKKRNQLFVLITALLLTCSNAICQWTDLNPWNNAIITSIDIYERTYCVATENGIWISQDSMQTWKTANTGLPSLRISKIFVNDKVVIATIDSQGVYISKDRGVNWEKSSFNSSNIRFLNLAYDNTNIYLGTNNGLYTSINEGKDWSNTIVSGEIKELKVVDNVLYCIQYWVGLLKSDDKGKTWEDLTKGKAIAFYMESFDVSGERILLIAEGGVTPFPNAVHLSQDKGKTWTNLMNMTEPGEERLKWPLTTAIIIDSIFYVRDFRGEMWKSTNFGRNWNSWKNTNNGYNFVYKKYRNLLFISNKNTQFEYQTKKYIDNFKYSLIAPHSKYMNSLFNSNGDLYIGIKNGVMKSTDNGMSLLLSYNITDFEIYNYNDLIVENSGEDIYIVHKGNEYRKYILLFSSDKGSSWDSTLIEAEFEGVLKKLLINKDTLTLISEDAYIISTNAGKNWSQTIKHIQIPYFMDVVDGKWYFNPPYSKILESDDKGKTFKKTFIINDNNIIFDKLIFRDNGFIVARFYNWGDTNKSIYYYDFASSKITTLDKNLPEIKEAIRIQDFYYKNGLLFCLMRTLNTPSLKLYYLRDMNGMWEEYPNKENAILGSKLYADDKYLYSFSPRFHRTELSNFVKSNIEDDLENNKGVITSTQSKLIINLANEPNQSVVIYNSIGQIVYSQVGISEIEITNFMAGVYFIQIQSNSNAYTNKFLKY